MKSISFQFNNSVSTCRKVKLYTNSSTVSQACMSRERKIFRLVAISPWKKKSVFGRHRADSKPLNTLWKKGGGKSIWVSHLGQQTQKTGHSLPSFAAICRRVLFYFASGFKAFSAHCLYLPRLNYLPVCMCNTVGPVSLGFTTLRKNSNTPNHNNYDFLFS